MKPLCPDGGTCHHECESVCFRVQCCGPLSGVYSGDEWPASVREFVGPDTEPEEWAFPVPQREFYLVSSPMTGRPDLNIPVIRDVITKLARTGIVAFNPFAKDDPSNLLKQDPHYFTTKYVPVATHPRCAGVVLLPGWEQSDGATTEAILAVRFDKPLFEYRVSIDPTDGHAHVYLQQIERSVTIS